MAEDLEGVETVAQLGELRVELVEVEAMGGRRGGSSGSSCVLLLVELLLVHDLVLNTLEGELDVPALQGEPFARVAIRIEVTEDVTDVASGKERFDGVVSGQGGGLANATVEDDGDLARLGVGVDVIERHRGARRREAKQRGRAYLVLEKSAAATRASSLWRSQVNWPLISRKDVHLTS